MRLIPSLGRREANASTLLVRIDATAPSRAGWVTGCLSLPVTTTWDECVFPAGDYTLVVPLRAPFAIVHVQGADRDAMVFAAIVEDRPRGRTSALTLRRDGTSYRVHSLELKDPGVAFLYCASGFASDAPRVSPNAVHERDEDRRRARAGFSPVLELASGPTVRVLSPTESL